MPDKEEEQAPEGVDEHGLKIQEHHSKVLVIVPSEGFAETSLRYARSALHNIHVGTVSVSTEYDELIHGQLQDEFQVDRRLDAELRMEEFSGILVCAGSGAASLAKNTEALRLLREADGAKKLIGAWGEAIAVLAAAGVVSGRRLTGDSSLRDAVRAAGGRYTGTQVERDKNLVTGIDDAAGFRFAKALVQVVGI